MRKPLLLLAAVVAVAFGVITIAKRRASEGLGAGAAPTAPDRQKIKTFWAAYNQANLLRNQTDFPQAVPAYRAALQLKPQHEDSLYYLGTSLEELGNYREAAESFRRLLELNPASGRASGELGNVLSLLAPGAPADFEQARQAILRNLEINREQAGPFLRLGLLDLDQGHLEAALENFRIAAGFGSQEGNFYVGYTLFLQQRYQEAVPYFRKVLDAYGRDRKIIGKGVLSEGDVLPAPGKPMTALEKAGLDSMLFLYWSALRLGGYPPGVLNEFQVQPRPSLKPEFQPAGETLGLRVAGGRATTLDFDKDGETDLVVVGLGQPLKLYRRVGEKLVDTTDSAGLSGINSVWDAYAVDYDGDGYPDLYLIRSGFLGAGQNLLYHNNRGGSFSNVTRAMGLEGIRATAKACFLDFDGDSRVDLLEVGASDSIHGPLRPAPDGTGLRLFRNTGKRFEDVTRAAGLTASGTAVDCAVGDYDRDGKPDLFVLNWKQDAVLYRNLGNGRFTDVTEQAGLKGIRGESFSALFFDYDRDGFPDLLVTAHAPYEDVVRCLLQPGFRATRNTPRLFRNQGNGQFEEVSQSVGLTRCYGTLQAIAADLNGDGWPDLLFANGSLDAHRLEPGVVLRNVGGKEFREWFYLPDFDSPSNFLGATIAEAGPRGAREIYLASHPLLPKRLSHGGLWVNSHDLRARVDQSRPAKRD